jgi:7-keto-8-aminopelargonate synthetase-like enzyme
MQHIVWTPTSPDRLVQLENGTKQLWFSGTDYLGLAHFEPLQIMLKEGISKMGTHYGSSRNNTVRLSIYEEAETLLAQYLQLPKALTVSSGMLAGQLVIQHLASIVNRSYQVHYAPQVHPAIIGPDYTFSTRSWNEWAVNLVQYLNKDNSTELHVIVTDSLGSPWVQAYDFSLFTELSKPQQVLFVVDDSHGIGITGSHGIGIANRFKEVAPMLDFIVVSSLNKALGIAAGVIAGGEHYIQRLTQIGLFSGASPMAPFYAYALVQMLKADYYRQQFVKVQENVAYLKKRGLYNDCNWTSIEKYPALCSYREDIHHALLAQGIVTSCFAYPTIYDAPVMRLVINAAHTQEDLDMLLDALSKT